MAPLKEPGRSPLYPIFMPGGGAKGIRRLVEVKAAEELFTAYRR